MVMRGIGHASFSDAELLFGNMVPQTVLSVRARHNLQIAAIALIFMQIFPCLEASTCSSFALDLY